MSNVLVLYATVEGQSRKIAEHICDHTVRLCRSARVVDAAHLPASLNLADFDAVIIVASVHMGRHHQAAAHFVRSNAEALQRMPGALVSVSLHAVGLEASDVEEAREYVDLFAGDTGWIPHAVHYAAGALRFTRYDFFKRWMLRRIAAERGLDANKGEDIEFTDWHALDTFVTGFLNTHAPVGGAA